MSRPVILFISAWIFASYLLGLSSLHGIICWLGTFVGFVLYSIIVMYCCD